MDSALLGPIAPGGTVLSHTLTCPSGGIAISSGYATSGSFGVVGSNTRLSSPSQWAIDFMNPYSSSAIYVRMHIICLVP